MVVVNSSSFGGLNDYPEGNLKPGAAIGYFVEFGGYVDGFDPGKPDNALKGMVQDHAAPVEAQATINGLKYDPIADALAAAKDGDTIVIVNSVLTACTDKTLKKGVTIEALDGKTYTATADTVLDIAADGSITVKDGVLELSNQAPVKVYDPKDGNTYAVTAPDSKSTVNVDNQGDHPYIRGENDGTVQIGNVSYTYKNPAGQMAMVYIPDAMYRNERVTKAEVTADKSAVIKLDDGEENTVEIKGNGSAADKVTVERRTDKKAEVKLPSGTKAKVFGHEVDTAPAGGVTVGQSSAENTGYPDRDYIVIAVAGEKVTVDGIEYVATENNQKFYLGTFKATVTIGSNAEITSGQKQTDVGYLKTYTVKISPKADYDLDQDNFMVTMKESDKGTVKNLKFVQGRADRWKHYSYDSKGQWRHYSESCGKTADDNLKSNRSCSSKCKGKLQGGRCIW